ncbi:MAG TPA: DNA polymerase I [Anaerolineales bacterium]|nr:DNA polymerase I [Anaerolineales bacterium]
MASKPRFFLIDGHALAYRTYYALTRAGDSSRWMTKSGEPTAGTYGFASVLLRLLEKDAPEYLAVSFDTGRTFRDEAFPEYKATRAKMPEDLAPQLDRIRELVEAFGIPVLEKEGFEADDVLGTVAERAARQDVAVTILTGDRDLLQLASERITVRLAGQKLSEALDYGPADVKAKFGIQPGQLVDYKALVGDTSDNIPGVNGIGEKTAVALLAEFGSLEGVYGHLDQVPARFRAKLEQGRDSALLSQHLARIVTDVDLPFDLDACRWTGYDLPRVSELFHQLEFRSLLERLPAPERPASRQLNMFAAAPVEAPAPVAPEAVIDTSAKLAALLQRLASADQIAFDLETTSTNEMRAELVGISLAFSEDDGVYLPVGHQPAFAGGAQLPLDQVLAALAPSLVRASLAKVGHNLKYDFTVLARLGVRSAPLAFDTMIAEWLCDPASHNLGLKPLAFVRLGRSMTEIESLIGRGKGQRSMAEVPIAAVAPYAIADACVCLALQPALEAELEAKRQRRLFEEVEMPLVSVLADMEAAGVRLDRDFLLHLSAELEARLADLEQQIFQAVGHPFNLHSTQQLSRVLFDELGLSAPGRNRRTSAGLLSTAGDVLEDMRQAHPVVALIVDHREIAKLKSTYADALAAQIDPSTGRVHTSFSQTGSVTGRLASSDPNLQNIPIRTELGRRIRQAFVAAPGQQLLSVDYSQIELRIVAHMAEDEAMIRAFHDDQDIHATTAAAVFGVPAQGVTDEMRRQAKAVNFGLIYGMSPFGLSRSTGMPLAEAEAFVQAYFNRFPAVRRYLDEVRAQAARLGFVETLLGRRRYFPQLMVGGAPASDVARARAKREAVNAPIQGSAADIIKLAMLRLPGELRQAGLSGRLLLQVHDELVLECPAAELRETARRAVRAMQSAFELRVPLKADAKAGLNWAEMQPVA